MHANPGFYHQWSGSWFLYVKACIIFMFLTQCSWGISARVFQYCHITVVSLCSVSENLPELRARILTLHLSHLRVLQLGLACLVRLPLHWAVFRGLCCVCAACSELLRNAVTNSLLMSSEATTPVFRTTTNDVSFILLLEHAGLVFILLQDAIRLLLSLRCCCW